MKQELTPQNAWKDFIGWVETYYKANINNRIPREIHVAKYAADGRLQYGLGVKRMQKLFEKYRPGYYQFEQRDVFVVDTDQKATVADRSAD